MILLEDALKRINEELSAKQFVEKIKKGYYHFERSQHTEVDYKDNKEERDTKYVHDFTKSDMFKVIKANLN